MNVVVPAPGLRESRARRGLSVVHLAKAAGVAPSVLAAVESGTRQPGAPRRRRLLQELDASFDERFTVRVL